MTMDRAEVAEARSHVEAALKSLLACTEADDPLGQAQISSLRAVICLLRSRQGPLAAGERWELLDKSRVRTRSSLTMISHVLSQETVGA
ncbi:hypothetical protein [Streptomyces sp. NPDC088915]|uniref:hypothetical protein n=1 Tax=Streptomyces sp. NPDC088915 TaxID=3365912 RepID=UPI0037F876DC